MAAISKHKQIYDSNAFRFPLVYELREMLRYRFLITNLVSRDLKVRYKRSVLGFVWVMLNPLLTLIVLTAVFSRLFRSNVPHYPVYVLIGLLLWNVFAQGSTAAMANLAGNGGTLRKMYVPPSVFVVSAIGSALINFLFALVPFALISTYTGVYPEWRWVFLVIPITLTTMLTIGIGLVIAAMFVFFTDTFEIYQVLINLFYFATPIIYADGLLDSNPILSHIEKANPMRLYLLWARDIILYHRFPTLPQMGLACAYAFVILLIGWVVFTRVEDKFAYNY